MKHDDEENPIPTEWESKVFPMLAAKVRKYTERAGAAECWSWLGSHKLDGYGRVCLPVAEFGRGAGGAIRKVAASRALIILRAGRELCSKTEHALHSCDHPSCCNPAHIRVGTIAENTQEAFSRGLIKPHPQLGEANPACKLTDAQVAEIRTLYAAGGCTQMALGRKFGVEQTTISKIVRGKYWRHAMPSGLASSQGRS